MPAKLSKRETEVLKFIGDGLSVSDIAEQLILSVKTVSTYRARLLEKLNLPHSAALMRYAIVNGISPLNQGTDTKSVIERGGGEYEG